MRTNEIATHGQMAEGLRSTIEIIAGEQENLTCICAYTKECPDPMPEFQKLLVQYPDDEIVIMTDLFGGSVNNNALILTQDSRIHVVTGVSLALAIGILTSDMEEDTVSVIRNAIEEAKDAMMYCEHMDIVEVEDDEF